MRPHLNFGLHLLVKIVLMVSMKRTTTVIVMKEIKLPVVGRLMIIVRIRIAFGNKIEAENAFAVLTINTEVINDMTVVVVMMAAVGVMMHITAAAKIRTGSIVLVSRKIFGNETAVSHVIV